MQPEGKPVLNDQGYLIMRPRLVVFVEDRMIRRDGVGELFGFREFVWSSLDFDTARSPLCLAPAADGAVRIFREMGKHVVSGCRFGLVRVRCFALYLFRSRGARGRTWWRRLRAFHTIVFCPWTNAR